MNVCVAREHAMEVQYRQKAGVTWTVAAMPGGAILVQCRVPAGQKQAKVMPLMDSTARTHHRDPHRCIVE